MASWHAGNGRLLTLAEASVVLGEPEEAVLADAAAGNLTWVTEHGRTLYPEDVVQTLAARRVPPPEDDPLIPLARAADILGVGRASAARLLTRDPEAMGQRTYRRSVVLALKAHRDVTPRRLSPESLAALQAARHGRKQ